MSNLLNFFFPSSNQDSNRADLTEFQQMTFIWISLIEGIVSVAWQIFANNQLILLLSLSLHGLAIWVLFRNLRLGVLIWVVAVSSVVIASVGVYQSPQVAFFLCIIVLLSVLVLGYLEGLLALIFVAAIALSMPDWFQEVRRIEQISWPVVGFSIALLVTGSIFRYWFMATIRVYYENYLYSIREVNEAREQRVEFKQIQEDILLANRELARLSHQLKMANQAAEEARRAKETFVATVSHELRTPLNMIIGFSEVIAQSPQVYGGKLPPSLLADIASIQRNSQHLLELINDVLDLSQVDMGNLSISRSRCSVETIISEAFDVIKPLYKSKGLYLTSEIQHDLEEINCDQTRIREVIINLLSNAGRFTEIGGVNVKVEKYGDDLLVSVTDTGPGIAEPDHKRLFEPFQQLDDTIRRKHGGSGLGLAISKRFVEMHGGKMWLESTIGIGTTFYFSLPMSYEPPLLQTTTTLSERWVNQYSVVDARTRPFKALPGQLVPRCIIIEEGQAIRHLFERYLGELEIVSVDHVDEALEICSTSPAQFIVINHPDAIAMQEMVCSSDKLAFGTPVVAFWLPGTADSASSLHANSYLIKPVSKDALLGSIESIGRPAQTILLVDDNPEVLQLFGRILQSREGKCRVLRATDGQQALDMLHSRQPDLMILDLIMPGISGFDVLAEKEKDPKIRDIPTIIVSAQDPAGIQRVQGQVSLSRQDGFSPRELLELIQATAFLKTA